MQDVRKVNKKVSGDSRMPVLGELNERAISIDKVREAVNEMKSSKVPGLNGFPVECLKKGGMVICYSCIHFGTSSLQLKH